MSLNDPPSANRIHIGFFGRRNAGKSSLVNAVTAQDLAVVSDRPGTTTDPVQKAMELLPLGPVVMTDTPGFDDDEQELGSKYVMEVCAIKYDYIASKLMTAARGFTLPQLIRAVELCGEADYRMKSSGQDARELLKEVVARIAAGESKCIV